MRAAAVIGAVMLALAPTPAAVADPPARITIVSVFDPVTYGENAYVNGQLLGDDQGGQLVALEQSPPPFTEWTPVLQATSDPMGYYSFKLHPTQTMQYRTSSQGAGSERVVQISVAPRIRLKAEAVNRTSVRYSGRFAPVLAGQSVTIQRRLPGGGWANVVNARLHGGSRFAGRFRARHSMSVRAFYAGDGAHTNAGSNVVKIARTGGAASARAAAGCRKPSITRISTRPAPPVAGRGAALRVAASLPGGKLYAIDVLWGEADMRDHFTLAPSARAPKVVFTLRHRWAKPGAYTLRVRVSGRTAGCRSSRTERPRLRVVSEISPAGLPAAS
jgi:hypothetical protein